MLPIIPLSILIDAIRLLVMLLLVFFMTDEIYSKLSYIFKSRTVYIPIRFNPFTVFMTPCVYGNVN